LFRQLVRQRTSTNYPPRKNGANQQVHYQFNIQIMSELTLHDAPS
jgi:hypothetical protein